MDKDMSLTPLEERLQLLRNLNQVISTATTSQLWSLYVTALRLTSVEGRRN